LVAVGMSRRLFTDRTRTSPASLAAHLRKRFTTRVCGVNARACDARGEPHPSGSDRARLLLKKSPLRDPCVTYAARLSVTRSPCRWRS